MESDFHASCSKVVWLGREDKSDWSALVLAFLAGTALEAVQGYIGREPSWLDAATNALGTGISGPDYRANPGAAGRCIPPLQDFRILNDEGAEVPLGEIGELVVKSPANMRCYLNKPAATAASSASKLIS